MVECETRVGRARMRLGCAGTETHAAQKACDQAHGWEVTFQVILRRLRYQNHRLPTAGCLSSTHQAAGDQLNPTKIRSVHTSSLTRDQKPLPT